MCRYDQSVDATVYTVEQYNSLENPEDRAAYTEIKATADGWRVSWAEPSSAPGKGSCWPSMRRHNSIQHQPYSAQTDGRIWCVEVDHPDHLIFAQRAERHNGIVTKQSRPIIVGNCTSNRELFQLMVRTLGPLPLHPFRTGKFAYKYLTGKDCVYTPSMQPTPQPHAHGQLSTSQPHTSEFYHLYRLNNIAKALASRDRDYVSFILGLLEYDPSLRLTPTQALFHPFFGKLCPLGLLFGDAAAVAPAVAGVTRSNTKQTQQQQQAEAWAAYHPSLINPRQIVLPPPPPQPPPTALALQAPHLGAIRSPYLNAGRSLRGDTTASPVMSAAFPSSPLTSSNPFSLQASPLLFSTTSDASSSRRLLHPSLLPSDPQQLQQLLSPSSNMSLVQLPTISFPPLSMPLLNASTPMETFYPTALSSFYNIQHASTPILTARPPPVLPRFPGSPDLMYAQHPAMMAASPPAYASHSPSTAGGFSPHFFAGNLASTVGAQQQAAAAQQVAAQQVAAAQQAHLQHQQQQLVESSLKFAERGLQGSTPVATARALSVAAAGDSGSGQVHTSPNGGVTRLSRRRSTKGSVEEKNEDSPATESRSVVELREEASSGGSGKAKKRSLGPAEEARAEEDESSRRRRRTTNGPMPASSPTFLASVSAPASLAPDASGVQLAAASADVDVYGAAMRGIPPSVLARLGVPGPLTVGPMFPGRQQQPQQPQQQQQQQQTVQSGAR